MYGYRYSIEKKLKAKLKRTYKKDKKLYNAVTKKIEEIMGNPHRYKPLRHDLKGSKRVHLEKSFVLVFEMDEAEKNVRFLDIGQDDESVFGHVIIAFLSLYIHCKLEQLLKKAELNHKFTPIDLLFEYSKVYHLEMRGRDTITEVPKKVRDLDEALGLYMFPKMIRS